MVVLEKWSLFFSFQKNGWLVSLNLLLLFCRDMFVCVCVCVCVCILCLNSIRSSLEAQQVKHPASSLLWLWLQLWHGFDPLHSHFTRWLSHLKNGGGDELYQMIPNILGPSLVHQLAAGGMVERRLLEFPSRRIGNESD